MAGTELTWFDDLGARVEQRWRRAGGDERAFAGLAAAALREDPPRMSSTDIAAWLLARETLPVQQIVEGNFGQASAARASLAPWRSAQGGSRRAEPGTHLAGGHRLARAALLHRRLLVARWDSLHPPDEPELLEPLLTA